MIDETLYSLLSGITSTPVWADEPPDHSALPQVIYSITSTIENLTLDESGVSDTITNINVDVRASERSEALAIADTINATLSGYKGGVDLVQIDLIAKTGRLTIVEKELGIYRITQDYTVHH